MAKVHVFELPVLPAAGVFPMMADDELQELADDIKERGLDNPLVTAEVDGELVLVDGRVEPEARHLNGADPTAYVLSANVHRRHMTKGQKTMAMARLLETSTAPQQRAAKMAQMGQQHISQARTVLRFAPDLADNVMGGATSLDEAYQKARDRKNAASSDESPIPDLRASHPELADKVVEGELTWLGPWQKPGNGMRAPRRNAPTFSPRPGRSSTSRTRSAVTTTSAISARPCARTRSTSTHRSGAAR